MARTLAIGDIHGCINALLTLEKFVGFQESDTIITLGDYVDRGPNSCAVIDWLIFTNHKRKLIPLRGNHDLMMLKASTDRKWKHDWMAAGGEATLRSYSPFDHDPGSMVDIPETHWDFLENHLLPYYETDTHIFVHANLLPDLPMSDQPEYYLYWQDFDDNSGHESGKIMVCGHNSQKSGRPKLNDNAVCIDTYVYGSGWLTCLDVGTGKVWQSNENGDTRVYILQEYNYDN